ncbi:MAG: hypothetical protein K8R48_06565 [Alphaproteobacteria bacterium]|nr:hypothetical protein [Alphaproteobacteria bacterium]
MKKLYLAILGLSCGLIMGGYGAPAFALPSQCTTFCVCDTTVDPHVCKKGIGVAPGMNRATAANPAANPIVPPTLSKVGPLTPTLESDVNTIIARELPGGESPSAAANRKKKCEAPPPEGMGGTWVGGTLIVGQQANNNLGGIQYIPGHCNAAAATTPQ